MITAVGVLVRLGASVTVGSAWAAVGKTVRVGSVNRVGLGTIRVSTAAIGIVVVSTVGTGDSLKSAPNMEKPKHPMHRVVTIPAAIRHPRGSLTVFLLFVISGLLHFITIADKVRTRY
jgi:hypothetical protein